MSSGARLVMANIEQMLGNLRFALDLADLSDTEYRQRLQADGYEVGGARWSRAEIEAWIARLDRTLVQCKERLANGDVAFFDALHWYGAAMFLDADERLGKYADRFGPAIRSRQKSDVALEGARKDAATANRKIDDAKYDRLKPTAKNDKDLARLLDVSPSTLSRYKTRRFS